MQSLWNDVRYSVRMLVRKPILSATAILVLALGIGANTLVFSVVDAVLLRPLPYPQPDQLVWINQGISPSKAEYALAPDFSVWQLQMQSFLHIAAFSEQYRNLTGRGEPKQILTAQVSAEFLPVLGIQPILGRNFLAEEDQPGNRRVAILTHSFWLRRFGEQQPCIGETIKIDNEPFEIVGVLSEHYRFPEALAVDVLIPLALGEEQANRESAMKTGIRQVNVIARLKPGTTLEQGQAELNAVQQGIVQLYPDFQEGREARLQLLHEHLSAGVSQTSLVLMGAVGLLLLLGCLNIGSLLLARTISRRAELTTRISLGASRMRLFRQLLTENAVLTFLGGLSGVLAALWGQGLLLLIIPRKIYGIMDLHIDARIIGVAVISFMLTTLLISLITALVLPTQNIADYLKVGAASVVGSSGLRRILGFIVVGELALAVILLAGAGLMIRSFWGLRYGGLGLRPDQTLTLRIDLTPSRYPESDQQAAFFESVIQRLALLPGVEAVAICNSAPPVPVEGAFLVSIEGQTSPPTTTVRPQAVSSEYFRALRIPLAEGRTFSDRDREGMPLVVMVNRAFTRQYLGTEQAVGKRIRLGGSRTPLRIIIGVVEDFKNVGLATNPEPEVYLPYRQFPLLASMDLMIRSSAADPLGLVPAIRGEIWALDKEQPLADIQTLDQRLSASVAQPRFIMVLLVGFASLALVLAAVGVYGIMSYINQQRDREIAIRIALGAQKAQVVWMILRHGLGLILLGTFIGTIGALAAGRLLSSMLYGISPADPFTFLIILAVLVLTTMAGCYFPAAKAIRRDPVEVLRYE
jgi:putative ABC transport system permease protein